jgi:hypothetical protein
VRVDSGFCEWVEAEKPIAPNGKQIPFRNDNSKANGEDSKVRAWAVKREMQRL